MELLLLTCAESCATDATTNRLSIFHVMEHVGAATFPVALRQLSFIALLSKTRQERQKVSLQIRFTLNKQSLADLPFELNFQDKLLARGVAEIHGLVIPGPGKLHASLHYKNKNLGVWTIEVEHIGKPGLVQKASASAAAGGPADSAPKARARKAPKKKSK